MYTNHANITKLIISLRPPPKNGYISSTSNQLDESGIKFKIFNGTSSVSAFWSKG